MLFTDDKPTLTLSANAEPPEEPRRGHRPGGVVWRPHYEGFTTIAYRDGHAIAGISGPWSDQYVLIWWKPKQPVRRVELFDSLEAAKAAVARHCGEGAGLLGGIVQALCREPIVLPQPAWLRRLRRRRGRSDVRRFERGDTDLRGLHFRAVP